MASEDVPLLGTVSLPPLADGRDAVLWPGLLELVETLRQPYVLIGGQMVHLHGAVAGRQSPRVTADIDLLLDVRAQVTALKAAVRAVERLGYRVDGMSPDLLAHRYLRADDRMVIDLLAPDHLGPRADLTTTPPGRTIEVPGGTTTLRHRGRIEVEYGGRTGTVHVPDLPYSVLSKCRALLREHPVPGPLTRSRHLEDIAFLVSLITDPDEVSVRPPETLAVLDDPAHYVWRQLGDFSEDGHLVWRQLRTPR
jgi:hypothetical protein